jgi:hypothetical protein
MQSSTNCCGAENRARDELTRLDDEEPEVIERHRSDERKVNE